VLFVHRDGECTIVEPQFCRNEPFERFAFQITPDGLPELCSLPTETQSKEDEVVAVLRDHFGGSVERAVLSHKLEEVLGLNRTTASMRIYKLIRKGLVNVDGKVISLIA
jgi:hypothetical protein